MHFQKRRFKQRHDFNSAPQCPVFRPLITIIQPLQKKLKKGKHKRIRIRVTLYFPLAEERNKWKMFSYTSLSPGPEGLFFESRAQCCLSVAFLQSVLSPIADVYLGAPVPTQPFI